MNKLSKILVLGSSGLVGSAVVRKLKELGYVNVLTHTHKALELDKQVQVHEYFAYFEPEYVFQCVQRQRYFTIQLILLNLYGIIL